MWAHYNLEMCLKNKLRGVPRGLFSSPKGFSLFKGDEIVLQPFSDSQDRFEAREKSILNDWYPISGPNASFICDYKWFQLILLVKAGHPYGKMKEKEEIMILNPLSAYVFWLIPLYGEGTKCGADYNMHGIIFKKAMGLQKIIKKLTMCIFFAQVHRSQTRQRRSECQCAN